MNWLAEAHTLTEAGESFVLATVVRRVAPASAQPGDKALIRGDGSMHGWVGGSCAQPVVAGEARAALRDGRPRLLRLGQFPDAALVEGVVEHPMTCHSGGALEILIEPVLPAPHLAVVGSTPVAATLTVLARTMGYRVSAMETADELVRVLDAASSPPFVAVATMGVDDEAALVTALASNAPYVALVASPKRAATVRETLARSGVPDEDLNRLKAPAGLDIGARTQEEIALSIVAEIIRWRSVLASSVAVETSLESPSATDSPAEAIDPICGMTVVVAAARHVSALEGKVWYFCCGGCKAQFDANPGAFVTT
jgi:xanthine dehydrogenase accessory factor